MSAVLNVHVRDGRCFFSPGRSANTPVGLRCKPGVEKVMFTGRFHRDICWSAPQPGRVMSLWALCCSAYGTNSPSRPMLVTSAHEARSDVLTKPRRRQNLTKSDVRTNNEGGGPLATLRQACQPKPLEEMLRIVGAQIVVETPASTLNGPTWLAAQCLDCCCPCLVQVSKARIGGGEEQRSASPPSSACKRSPPGVEAHRSICRGHRTRGPSSPARRRAERIAAQA